MRSALHRDPSLSHPKVSSQIASRSKKRLRSRHAPIKTPRTPARYGRDPFGDHRNIDWMLCAQHAADRFDDDPKRPSLFTSLVAPQIPRVPGSLPRSERLVRWRCGVLSSSSSVIRLQKPQSKRLAIRRYVHRTSGSAGAEGIPLRSQFDWYLSMCCKRGLVTRNVLEISRRSN